jgi:hypothetical protein
MAPDFVEAEALKLLKAFLRIEDPQARRIIIAIVEAAARGTMVRIEELAATDTLSELRSQLEDQGIDS